MPERARLKVVLKTLCVTIFLFISFLQILVLYCLMLVVLGFLLLSDFDESYMTFDCRLLCFLVILVDSCLVLFGVLFFFFANAVFANPIC